MATLISVYNSSGCVGRCDAKCYDATSAHCDCICGGRNHGAGEKQAQENTREYCQEWLDEFKKSKGLTEAAVEVNQEVFQLKLF
jgi:hypothetical protein